MRINDFAERLSSAMVLLRVAAQSAPLHKRNLALRVYHRFDALCRRRVARFFDSRPGKPLLIQAVQRADMPLHDHVRLVSKGLEVVRALHRLFGKELLILIVD